MAALSGTSHVYAVGGMLDWEQAVAVAERYDACANTWQPVAPLPEPLGYIDAAELNGKLYVVGGADRLTAGNHISGTYSVHNDTYVYDPQTDAWSAAAPLPAALAGVAVASANGKLYAFGGFDARGPSLGTVDTTYEYDPAANTWLTRTVILSGTRALAAATELDGKIYLVGGVMSGGPYWSTLGSVNVYDPATDSWSNAAPMKTAVHSPGLAAAPDGSLYVIGGGIAWYASISMERYDPATNTWTYADSGFRDFERAGTAAAYVNGRILLVGGTSATYDVTTARVESLQLDDDLCQSALRASQDTVLPGGWITYTVEIHGSIADIPHANLLDPIPNGTTFAGFDLQPAGTTYNTVLNRVEWHGDLVAQQPPITVTFGVVVSGTGWMTGQRITNTAVFDDGGGRVVQRSAATELGFFDLSPSAKSVDQIEVASGSALTYTVRVESRSTQSGTASFTDPIPDQASYVPGSVSASAGMASFAGNAIHWSGALPQWATHTNTSGDYEWGDSRGGGTVPGVRYEWIEASDGRSPIGFYAPTFGRCYPVTFPFGFPFYDTYFTEVAVQIDGTIFFMDPNNTGLYMGPINAPIQVRAATRPTASSPYCGMICIAIQADCSTKWSASRPIGASSSNTTKHRACCTKRSRWARRATGKSSCTKARASSSCSTKT